jgi:penicillin-binding protein-related factor A (putative recombinase)
MTSKEFEDICLYRMRQHEEKGEATMGRYGVQGTYMKDIQSGQMKWQPKKSLPDFEGILPPGGRQFIFDCKLCSQASFSLDDDHFKNRQLRHMMIRARFGAICFLLIHFTERILSRGIEPAETWAFPIWGVHPFWLAVDRAEVKRINRQDCVEYGKKIEWNVLPGGRTIRPDILKAVVEWSEGRMM